MIWTIRLCFMLALTSLSGTFAYLAWKICQVYLQRRKMLRWIYPMLAMVEPFFVLPFVCGMASMFQKETGASMTIGYALMGDRNVYLLCTSLSLVWAGGACFYLLRYVRTSWRVYWRLWRTRVPAEAGVQRLADEIRARLGIRQQIRVYVSPVMWTPMVINGLHKWILLPEQDWDRRELEVILCHELTHVKQRIIPLKAVGSLMRIVYWFTPVSHLYLDALDEWGETACDLSVRYDAGCVADFREYFFAVLAGVRMADDEPAGWTQFAKVKGVEKRIMRISKYERERDLRPVVGVALMVAFCLTCTTTVAAAGLQFGKGYDGVYREMLAGDKVNDSVVSDGEGEIVEDWDTPDEDVIELPLELTMRASNTFIWTVPAGKVARLTNPVWLTKGQTITVGATIQPSGLQANVGVITPDLKKRYAVGGTVTHPFEVEVNGYHYVFVENINSTDITATGYFAY